jgi:hypothetical protein
VQLIFGNLVVDDSWNDHPKPFNAISRRGEPLKELLRVFQTKVFCEEQKKIWQQNARSRCWEAKIRSNINDAQSRLYSGYL